MNCLLEFDQAKIADYNCALVGTDEAGRGPGAGGVFAAAVCFKPEALTCKELDILNDSKKLSAKKREALYDVIREVSYFCVVSVDVDEIERVNILQASLMAMRLAVAEVVKHSNTIVLVDGNKKIPLLFLAQEPIVQGDSKSAAIAAASILAKVERDRYMEKLHKKYPCYNWVQNKGYLTKEHIGAIKKHGVSEFHRPCFLKNILN